MLETAYQQCSKCVMDTIGDNKIVFDNNGICNYCHFYSDYCEPRILKNKAGKEKVEELIKKIKLEGENKTYNCILGLSGGVDSSYLAYLSKQYDLKPLCIHFDNGWNSELAVKNIENIVKILNYDLHTYVINWEEFKDLQRAYIKAGVIDIEALTDHAIFASIYKIAIEKNIKYVLSGMNLATEGILPPHWTHRKSDYINIVDIHKKYGTVPLKTFPLMTKKVKDKFGGKSFESVDFLNWIPYNKNEAKEVLKSKLNWIDYGGKHYESVFTKFYQAYILPTKFNVDKRKAHLSTLINSNQISKKDALEELKKPLYDSDELQNDKQYVMKKLGFKEEEFDAIMASPQKAHDDFDVEGSMFHYYPILKPLQPLWNFYKKVAKK
jgi:N-acetyl sugar amidotransferase